MKARVYLRSLILDQEISLETTKDRRCEYGRYLGEIRIDKKGAWLNVNDELVKTGWGEYVKY